MSHRYHWLVLRDGDGRARQSEQYGIRGGDNTQKPDNVILTIDGIHDDRTVSSARVLRAPPVSTNQLHAVLSESSWESGTAALAWAAKDGEMFLNNRVDAFIVALPVTSDAS
jgi:hypothetical protein